MNTQITNSLSRLSKQTILFFIVIFFLASPFLQARGANTKDSVLIILKSGRDKRYYKSCAGADVRVLSSFDKNQTEILTLVQGVHQPLIKGLNDNRCLENISLLQMAINNMQTGKVRPERKNSFQK